MTIAQSEIRIYVACLAAYNNGYLHGAWIDCTQGIDHIHEEIARVLKSSPIPDAEEWAIHDYEGFGSVNINESHDLEEIAEMGELFDRCDNPELVQGVMDQQMLSPQDALLYIEENYAGEHESLEDWAEQFLDETGQLESVSKNLRYYIDFERWAKDLDMSGEIFTIETGYKQVHVFWNS